MGERGIGSEPVDRRHLREVHLRGRLEREVFQALVFALVVGRALESQGVEGFEILLPVLAALLPRDAADRVRLTVGDGDVAVPALPDVPDDLFHDHQVPPQMREARGHEPGQHVKRGGALLDSVGYQVVVPVPDDDTPCA